MRAALRSVVLAGCLGAAGAAAAADLPSRSHAGPRDRVFYTPRGPAPAVTFVSPYRVVYQVPSNVCAENDFCPARF